eukprot:jgi/Botrbrau1/3786/Bobra.0183s0020.1
MAGSSTSSQDKVRQKVLLPQGLGGVGLARRKLQRQTHSHGQNASPSLQRVTARTQTKVDQHEDGLNTEGGTNLKSDSTLGSGGSVLSAKSIQVSRVPMQMNLHTGASKSDKDDEAQPPEDGTTGSLGHVSQTVLAESHGPSFIVSDSPATRTGSRAASEELTVTVKKDLAASSKSDSAWSTGRLDGGEHTPELSMVDKMLAAMAQLESLPLDDARRPINQPLSDTLRGESLRGRDVSQSAQNVNGVGNPQSRPVSGVEDEAHGTSQLLGNSSNGSHMGFNRNVHPESECCEPTLPDVYLSAAERVKIRSRKEITSRESMPRSKSQPLHLRLSASPSPRHGGGGRRSESPARKFRRSSSVDKQKSMLGNPQEAMGPKEGHADGEQQLAQQTGLNMSEPLRVVEQQLLVRDASLEAPKQLEISQRLQAFPRPPQDHANGGGLQELPLPAPLTGPGQGSAVTRHTGLKVVLKGTEGGLSRRQPAVGRTASLSVLAETLETVERPVTIPAVPGSLRGQYPGWAVNPRNIRHHGNGAEGANVLISRAASRGIPPRGPSATPFEARGPIGESAGHLPETGLSGPELVAASIEPRVSLQRTCSAVNEGGREQSVTTSEMEGQVKTKLGKGFVSGWREDPVFSKTAVAETVDKTQTVKASEIGSGARDPGRVPGFDTKARAIPDEVAGSAASLCGAQSGHVRGSTPVITGADPSKSSKHVALRTLDRVPLADPKVRGHASFNGAASHRMEKTNSSRKAGIGREDDPHGDELQPAKPHLKRLMKRPDRSSPASVMEPEEAHLATPMDIDRGPSSNFQETLPPKHKRVSQGTPSSAPEEFQGHDRLEAGISDGRAARGGSAPGPNIIQTDAHGLHESGEQSNGVEEACGGEGGFPSALNSDAMDIVVDAEPPGEPPPGHFKGDQVVPLTFEVFQRMYLSRTYLESLLAITKQAPSKNSGAREKIWQGTCHKQDEFYRQAVQFRYVRRKEQVEGEVPQYWLRQVLDVQWPYWNGEGKRPPPTLLLEDGVEMELKYASDASAEEVWGTCEKYVLWYRTRQAGRGLPSSHAPLKAAQVERASLDSWFLNIWCAINTGSIGGANDKLWRNSLREAIRAVLKREETLSDELWSPHKVPRAPTSHDEEADQLEAIFREIMTPANWDVSPTASPLYGSSDVDFSSDEDDQRDVARLPGAALTGHSEGGVLLQAAPGKDKKSKAMGPHGRSRESAQRSPVQEVPRGDKSRADVASRPSQTVKFGEGDRGGASHSRQPPQLGKRERDPEASAASPGSKHPKKVQRRDTSKGMPGLPDRRTKVDQPSTRESIPKQKEAYVKDKDRREPRKERSSGASQRAESPHVIRPWDTDRSRQKVYSPPKKRREGRQRTESPRRMERQKSKSQLAREEAGGWAESLRTSDTFRSTREEIRASRKAGMRESRRTRDANRRERRDSRNRVRNDRSRSTSLETSRSTSRDRREQKQRITGDCKAQRRSSADLQQVHHRSQDTPQKTLDKLANPLQDTNLRSFEATASMTDSTPQGFPLSLGERAKATTTADLNPDDRQRSITDISLSSSASKEQAEAGMPTCPPTDRVSFRLKPNPPIPARPPLPSTQDRLQASEPPATSPVLQTAPSVDASSGVPSASSQVPASVPTKSALHPQGREATPLIPAPPQETAVPPPPPPWFVQSQGEAAPSTAAPPSVPHHQEGAAPSMGVSTVGAAAAGAGPTQADAQAVVPAGQPSLSSQALALGAGGAHAYETPWNHAGSGGYYGPQQPPNQYFEQQPPPSHYPHFWDGYQWHYWNPYHRCYYPQSWYHMAEHYAHGVPHQAYPQPDGASLVPQQHGAGLVRESADAPPAQGPVQSSQPQPGISFNIKPEPESGTAGPLAPTPAPVCEPQVTRQPTQPALPAAPAPSGHMAAYAGAIVLSGASNLGLAPSTEEQPGRIVRQKKRERRLIPPNQHGPVTPVPMVVKMQEVKEEREVESRAVVARGWSQESYAVLDRLDSSYPNVLDSPTIESILEEASLLTPDSQVMVLQGINTLLKDGGPVEKLEDVLENIISICKLKERPGFSELHFGAVSTLYKSSIYQDLLLLPVQSLQNLGNYPPNIQNKIIVTATQKAKKQRNLTLTACLIMELRTLEKQSQQQRR